MRLVISAVQDEDAKQYFDLDQQSSKTRTAYRNRFSKTGFKDEGYNYTKAEWKKSSRYGRMLSLRYIRTLGKENYRGVAYRTIRNGYTIVIDYQVTGRNVKNKDSKALTDIMKTFRFTQVLAKPATAVAKITYTELPPKETSSGKFTIKGTCAPGVAFYGVAKRMSSGDSVQLSAVGTEKGRFTIDVALPAEGYWLITLAAQVGTEELEEKAFDVINYSRGLIPVNLTTDFTAKATSDEYAIAGTTLKNVNVQCIVNKNGSAVFTKTITTNGTGRVRFKVPMKTEGEYEIILVFQKNNYHPRRYTFTVTREVTANSQNASVRKEAIKPAYSTLTKKLTGYTGRTMGYNLYYIEGQQAGDEWVLTMAMTSSKKGYKNLIYVITDDDPGFSAGSKHKMYGVCTGAHSVTDGDNVITYPCFNLLFWDDAE